MPHYRVFIVDDEDRAVRARDLATLDHEQVIDEVTQADEHLRHAEECMLIAKLASSAATRAGYPRMAELYRQLATEEAMLNSAAAMDTRPRQTLTRKYTSAPNSLP